MFAIRFFQRRFFLSQKSTVLRSIVDRYFYLLVLNYQRSEELLRKDRSEGRWYWEPCCQSSASWLSHCVAACVGTTRLKRNVLESTLPCWSSNGALFALFFVSQISDIPKSSHVKVRLVSPPYKSSRILSDATNVHHGWRIKDQLDVTCYFISRLMCSTCFGH